MKGFTAALTNSVLLRQNPGQGATPRQNATKEPALQHSPSATPAIVVKHPETGVTDCAPPPPTCQGPCCGTCRRSEIDLLHTGLRLLLTKEWVSAGYYYLQLAVTRTSMRRGTHIKCALPPLPQVRQCHCAHDD